MDNTIEVGEYNVLDNEQLGDSVYKLSYISDSDSINSIDSIFTTSSITDLTPEIDSLDTFKKMSISCVSEISQIEGIDGLEELEGLEELGKIRNDTIENMSELEINELLNKLEDIEKKYETDCTQDKKCTQDNYDTILIFFLKNIIKKIEDKTITNSEKYELTRFILNYTNKDKDKNETDCSEMTNMMKYYMLGWYIYEYINIKK